MTVEQRDAVADVIYRVEAPRWGNDIKPFEALGHWEKRKYQTMAENAVTKWESLRPSLIEQQMRAVAEVDGAVDSDAP